MNETSVCVTLLLASEAAPTRGFDGEMASPVTQDSWTRTKRAQWWTATRRIEKGYIFDCTHGFERGAPSNQSVFSCLLEMSKQVEPTLELRGYKACRGHP